jgi:hypothetical protein
MDDMNGRTSGDPISLQVDAVTVARAFGMPS